MVHVTTKHMFLAADAFNETFLDNVAAAAAVDAVVAVVSAGPVVVS